MADKKLLITIDGPAGAGKTTVSRNLSSRLGYRYIDTGALYRAVALEVKRAEVIADDDAGIAKVLQNLDLKFVRIDDDVKLLSKGEDISGFIRTPEISMLASTLSAKQEVRDALLGLQKDIGREKEAVFEGRDMGTVVFPDADVKFFLDASTKVRAERRYLEMKNVSSQTFEEVEADIIKRDTNDSSREVAPLKPADDAVYIDSSRFSSMGVVDFMYLHIEKLFKMA